MGCGRGGSRNLRARRNQVLLGLTAASFAVWSLLLQSGDEYDALPTGVFLQPVVGAKFAATVVLFGVSAACLRDAGAADRTALPAGASVP